MHVDAKTKTNNCTWHRLFLFFWPPALLSLRAAVRLLTIFFRTFCRRTLLCARLQNFIGVLHHLLQSGDAASSSCSWEFRVLEATRLIYLLGVFGTQHFRMCLFQAGNTALHLAVEAASSPSADSSDHSHVAFAELLLTKNAAVDMANHVRLCVRPRSCCTNPHIATIIQRFCSLLCLAHVAYVIRFSFVRVTVFFTHMFPFCVCRVTIASHCRVNCAHLQGGFCVLVFLLWIVNYDKHYNVSAQLIALRIWCRSMGTRMVVSLLGSRCQG